MASLRLYAFAPHLTACLLCRTCRYPGWHPEQGAFTLQKVQVGQLLHRVLALACEHGVKVESNAIIIGIGVSAPGSIGHDRPLVEYGLKPSP